MRLKEGSSSARGYCGWHTTWDGKTVFLRSLVEYVVACMLDAEKSFYLTEAKTFEICGTRYKPDFFIYDESYTEIIKIIEVKPQGDKKSHDLYMEKFSDAFTHLGIEYEVIYRFDRIKTLYCSSDMQAKWRDYSKDTTNSNSVLGSRNPMYGVKHKASTKAIISQKAKQRFENDEYKNKHKEKLKAFYDSDRGQQFKEYLGELRRQEAQHRQDQYLALPTIITSCLQCDATIESREGYTLCSPECTRKWSYRNIESYGKHKDRASAGRKRLMTYLKQIADGLSMTMEQVLEYLDNSVAEAKRRTIIPKHKGITRKTLVKYNILKG